MERRAGMTYSAAYLQAGDIIQAKFEGRRLVPSTRASDRLVIIEVRPYTASAHNDRWSDCNYTLRKITRSGTLGKTDLRVSTNDALSKQILVVGTARTDLILKSTRPTKPATIEERTQR
jgi:hypothetical protein